MENIDLYVFSGTGNTLNIAKCMRSEFTSASLNCKLKNITSLTDPSSINLDHTIGIAFPIACFRSYPFVLKFISSLPLTDRKTKLFFLSTFAGNDGHVCAQLAPLFKAKGYDVIGYEGFIMPNNFMVKRIDEESNTKLTRSGQKRAIEFARRLIKGETKFKYDGKIRAMIATLIYKISFPTGFLRKMFCVKVDITKCTGCGICVELCPVGNFSIVDGKASIDNKCEDCMRCIGFCPEKAITLKKAIPYKACSYQEFISAFDE